jgi:WD40 repeat protein
MSTCLATLEGVHIASVLRLIITAERAFSSSADGTIGVWDLEAAMRGENALISHLVEHSDKVGALALDSSGSLFSGSADRTIKRWDPNGWMCCRSWRAHDAAVTCLAHAPAVEALCSGAEDGRLRLWRFAPADAKAEPILITTLSPAAPLKSIRTLMVEPSKGLVLCAGASDGTVCMWDLKEHMLLHILRAHIGNAVRAMCFGASDQLYVAGSDLRVVVWNVRMDEGKGNTPTVSVE